MNINAVAIRKNLARRRMTLKDGAQKIGMDRRTFTDIVNNGRCSIINAGRISDGLGIAFEELDGEARRCKYE